MDITSQIVAAINGWLQSLAQHLVRPALAAAVSLVRSFVAAQCATSAEGPKALFDRAPSWLIEAAAVIPVVPMLGPIPLVPQKRDSDPVDTVWYRIP